MFENKWKGSTSQQEKLFICLSFQQNQADFRAIQEASLICRHIAVDGSNVFTPVLLGALSSLSLSRICPYHLFSQIYVYIFIYIIYMYHLYIYI